MEQRFALAGDPVEHSLSPRMHRAALAHAGLTGSYELEKCDSDGFRRLLTRLGDEYTGLNVTMPHKLLAYALSAGRTGEAESAGSVNTMKAMDGKIWGHSSDVVAFRSALAGMDAGAPRLVIGSGGSAAAALAAIEGEVLIMARNSERAAALISRFGGRAALVEQSVHGAVVINCTPIGMAGEALPGDLVAGAAGLIDLPYGAGVTPAVSDAGRLGIPVVDGLRFLALQAVESFRWWTGVEVPLGTMVRAGRNA